MKRILCSSIFILFCLCPKVMVARLVPDAKPSSSNNLLNGIEAYHDGNYAKALSFLKNAKTSSALLQNYTRYWTGKTFNALDQFNNTLALFPNSSYPEDEINWVKLEAWIGLKKWDEALHLINQQKPNSSRPFYLAKLKYLSGQKEEAFGIYKNLLIQEPKSRFENDIIQLLNENGINIETFISYQDWLSRAEKLIESGLPKEAIKIYKQLDPSEKKLRILFGRAYFQAREYSQAASCYEDLLSSGEQDPSEILELLATSYARSNQFSKAIHYNEEMIRRYPGSKKAEIAQNKIRFIVFDSGAYQAIAKTCLDTPDPSYDWRCLWAFYWEKDYTHALNTLNRMKSSSKILYWKARLLEKSKHKKKARQIYIQLALDGTRSFYSILSSRKLKLSPRRHRVKIANHEAIYAPWIRFYANKFGLDPDLAWAIMRQESSFKPHALSNANAYGLMQIIPQTAIEIAEALGRKKFHPDDLKDPITNIEFGIWYIKNLLNEMKGNKAYAIASYNAGPDAVKRWIQKQNNMTTDEFVENIPYAETHHYVKKVLTYYWVYHGK